jgi:hypothetical protein
VMGLVLFIVGLLLVLNYSLDYLRYRENKMRGEGVRVGA